MSEYFKRKMDPHESVVLTFDFARALDTGETLTGTPTVTVTVVEGTDASPSSIKNGAASVSGGTKALQGVHNPVAGCTYAVECVAATTNSAKVLALTGLLRIVEGG